MTAPAFPTSFYLVFVRAVKIGPARWRLIHDEPLDTLDDAATAIDDYFGGHHDSANDCDLRVQKTDGNVTHSWTAHTLRHLAARYAARAAIADDVPLWLFDYAPVWVREEHDDGQLRQMYAEDR